MPFECLFSTPLCIIVLCLWLVFPQQNCKLLEGRAVVLATQCGLVELRVASERAEWTVAQGHPWRGPQKVAGGSFTQRSFFFFFRIQHLNIYLTFFYTYLGL